MSLQSQEVEPVPSETVRVAQAAFPKGTLYMRMRDEMGVFYTDAAFAALFSSRGQPALAPWRLALVTIMQYAEGLSDEQAASAVRGRIDWKYALSLELTDTGFDSSVLSEFRTRLIQGGAEEQLFEDMLTHFRDHQLLKARGRQRTDSTHVLAKVRALNRLECVGETMRCTLNSLAVVVPEWLCAHTQPEWVERYGPRVDDYRLPTGQAARQAYAETIGGDGAALLTAVFAPTAPAWLREVPAVETLRRVWVQQYQVLDGAVRWRADDNIPSALLMINSPYDPEARYGKKRGMAWVGYKVHVTETCDDDTPHLITHVATTSASTADGAMTAPIHQALARADRLPTLHIVDTGYTDAELVVTSQTDYDVDLLGPMRGNYQWQAHEAQGFDISCFHVDWEAQRATCPEGHTSTSWSASRGRQGKEVIKVSFALAACQTCPSRTRCTQATTPRRRLTLRPKDYHCALLTTRQRQTTVDFKTEYARRAGVEGTLSQGIHTCGLRRCRYRGQAKTSLQHVLTAAAMNFVRVGLWLTGSPRVRQRHSRFVALMAMAA